MKNWQEFINKIGHNRFQETEKAKQYVEIERIDELINTVKLARAHKIPHYIIGSGSFPLIPTTQINGFLIKNNCRRFEIFSMPGKSNIDASNNPVQQHKLVYAQSGTLISQLVRFTIEEGLSGLEYQLGMPGSIGGAIYTNVRYMPKNIYINDFISSIKILNSDNQIQDVDPNYFMSHPTQDFSPARDIILSATLQLFAEDKKILWERANEASEYRQTKEEK